MMNTPSRFGPGGLGRLLTQLTLLAVTRWPLGIAADSALEGHFREIQGEVRFNNKTPAILERLQAPIGEGMSSLSVRATGLPPDISLTAQVSPTTPGRIANSYQLTVQAGTNAATAIAYGIQAIIGLKSDRELFYTRTVETPPLVDTPVALSLDLIECVGLLRLQFVDTQGTSLTIDGGNGLVYAGNELRGQVFSLAAGSSESFLVVPAGLELSLNFLFQRGADPYHDQLQHTFTLVTNVPCDTLLTVPVVLRDATSLGRITGVVDMEGEFELSTGPSPVSDLRGRTAVIATGPVGNRRLDLIAGDNQLVPASGVVELENLLPSEAVVPAELWRVQAQLHFGRGRLFEWFISPALGEGQNPGIAVPAGGSVELGDRLRFRRSTLQGRVQLAGPPDTATARSVFRGLLRPGDDGVDAFGIPQNAAGYGLTASHIIATGQDVVSPGATYTAAGGRAAVDFDGEYDVTRAAFHGSYELRVGGLNGEASVWKRDQFALAIANVTNALTPYVNQVLAITDRTAPLLSVTPGETLTNHLSLGFSEVCLRFRTPGRRFYNPGVFQAPGEFTGLDFEQVARDYAVNIEAASGLPAGITEAADTGTLVLALPQGIYRLRPSLNVLNDDGTESITQLDEITLHVPARQRICVESCLQLRADIPTCTGQSARITGAVQTCGQNVTSIRYQLDENPPVVVCTDCGPAPELGFSVPIPPGPHLLTVIAVDEAGSESSVSGTLRADTEAPVIVCPGVVTVNADAPCGTAVHFELPVRDNCDSQVVVQCTPPSGSLFPLGATEVIGVATDAAGNRSECRFTVQVQTDGGPTGIRRFDWAAAPGDGQAELIITGTNFLRGDEVWLGNVRVPEVRWLAPSELRLVFPNLPPGVYAFTLRHCGEIVASRDATLGISGVPTLTSIDSGVVPAVGNTHVTLRGHFLTALQRVRVGFPVPPGQPDLGLLRNLVVSADGTTLTGIVPALPPGELPGLRSLVLEDPNGFVVSSLIAGPTYVRDPVTGDRQVVSLRKFQQESRTPASVRMRDGFPAHLEGRMPVTGATPQEQAQSFAREFSPLLRLSNPDQELVVSRVIPGPLSLVTLAQTHQGIPVFGAEIALHLADGEALNLLGFLLPTEALAARLPSVTPTLTAAQAEEIVRGARAPFPSVQLLQPSRVAIYDACVFTEGTPMDPHLVWRVSYRGADTEYFVDAHSGEIVFRRATTATDDILDDLDLEMQDAQNVGNVIADECSFSDYTFVADEDELDPAYRGNRPAQVLFESTREVYSYYRRHFNRNSYDDDGGQIEIVMNSNFGVNNAQYVSGCDIIELFPGTEDRETIAHEFTHGVINHSSGLIYQRESGALNEHFADVMAVLLDRELGSGNWTLSEKQLNGLAPIRDLSNPGSTNVASPQPAHYRNRTLLPANVAPSSANDQGGVHSNSGIPNLAAYRMIEGAFVLSITNNEPSVRINGLGVAKARSLFYAALTSLPANATFQQARELEIFLVEFLASRLQSGFTANDVCDVRNAWASVGVGAYDASCGNYSVPLDDDRDGVLNSQDNCPRRANPGQEDRDEDGVGDVCDNCPATKNVDQKDLDHDGVGDICDGDKDNDGCSNGYYSQDRFYYPPLYPRDWHPERAEQVSHYFKLRGSGNCEGGPTELLVWEGLDSDLDRELNCVDEDDDNDGLRDTVVLEQSSTDNFLLGASEDPCPTTPTRPGHLAGSPQDIQECSLPLPCVGTEPQPTIPSGFPPEIRDGIFVRFGQHVNPNPEGDFLWDNVRLAGDQVVLDPGVGVTVGQLSSRLKSLGKIVGANSGRAHPAAEPGATEPYRVELWARGTNGGPARLLRLLGDFDPNTASLVDVDTGAVLRLTPAGQFGGSIRLAGVWGDSQPVGSARWDTDLDGMPDGYEIRMGFNARDNQDGLVDTDGDGRRNFEEFLAGTDPRVANGAPLRLTATMGADGRLRLAWNGGPGIRLQRVGTLPSATWVEVPDTNGQSAYEVSPADASSFFRLARP